MVITWSDGSTLRTTYRIKGAQLRLNQYAEYVMELPIVGNWYASEASRQFTSTHLLYRIAPDGEATVYNFGADGFGQFEELQWERTQKGIRLLWASKEQELIYQADTDKLFIEGEGDYTHTPSYEGEWQSVDSSEGSIAPQDKTYSTVSIYDWYDELRFHCKYQEQSNLDWEYYPSSYQAIVTPLFTKQQQLLLLRAVDGTGTVGISFRFFYSKDARKVYLDLSKENNFTDYVRYEYLNP